jgi:hypothetical protein
VLHALFDSGSSAVGPAVSRRGQGPPVNSAAARACHVRINATVQLAEAKEWPMCDCESLPSGLGAVCQLIVVAGRVRV